MAKKVGVTINGKTVKVPEGTNLIDAASQAGVEIPNLCYIKGMRGIGACRLCLVEIEGGRGPVTACTTKVKDGMVVNTDTEQLREMRQFVIDLILSMHPLDCMTCTKAGVCTLQRYAYESEIKESSFSRKKFGYPPDESNPFIKRDPEYCILCARCVRVCKEQGTNVLDFMGRGVGAKVVTANDKPLHESGCTFCGSCIDACPVNAILEADRWRKGREWDYERTHSVCLLCGGACDTVISTKDNLIMKINAGGEDGSVQRYICAIGRFGYDAVASDKRVLSPLRRVNGELKETTWEEALQLLSERLTKGKASILLTGALMNEDISTLLKVAEDVIKTDRIATTVSLYADEESMKDSDTADIDSADLILLVGLNPSQWKRVHPSLDASIRRRLSRGARLVSISSEAVDIGEVADITLRGEEPGLIKQIAKSMISKGMKANKELSELTGDTDTTEETERVADLIKEAERIVIFTSPALFRSVRNLSLIKKMDIIAVPNEANARGVVLSGIKPDGKLLKEMIEGSTEVLYVFGEPPVERRPDTGFLVVQSPYMSNLAREADLVLPSTTPYESSGSIVSFTGRVKRLSRALRPYGEAKQHREILASLAKVMGKVIKEGKTDIKKALKGRSKPSPSPFEKKEGLEIDEARFMEETNSCVINSSRLLWLREAEKAVGV
jgi:NADH dehydrogenase/NADH:ubiquinone oxidoreductase subunit G